MSEADYSDAAFPLELAVNQNGVGGVSGLSATVAVRLFPTTNSYLDWTDNTFKIAGWGVKDQPMTDIGNGCYQASLNVAAMGFSPASGNVPQKLVAEYSTPGGSGTGGFVVEDVYVSELRPDAKLTRQYAGANRLEVVSGTMTLYEDDGVTVQSTQTVRDYAGNVPTNQPGVPAKRGAGPP